MRRVVIVGQSLPGSALCFRAFGRSLALRLGAHVASHDSPRAVLEDEAWVGAEPVGVFSESLFRRADTIVWLHFSPIAVLADTAGRLADLIKSSRWMPRRRKLAPAADLVRRASWQDVRNAHGLLMLAPQLYQLFAHPALAHARVVELRTPRQADLWLMLQRRRSGFSAPPVQQAAGSPPQALR